MHAYTESSEKDTPLKLSVFSKVMAVGKVGLMQPWPEKVRGQSLEVMLLMGKSQHKEKETEEKKSHYFCLVQQVVQEEFSDSVSDEECH